MSTTKSPFLKTYAALVVLAALFAYIFLIEVKKPDSAEPAKEKALELQKDQVRELTLTRQGAEEIQLTKQDEQWRLTAPLAAAADPNEVESLLSSLANLEISEVVGDSPAKLADFGLDPPQTRLALRLEGAAEPLGLLLGAKAPDGTSLYAKRPAEGRVFVVPSYLESTFDKKPFDLRDRDVLHVKRDAVRTLEVRGPEGSYRLNRDDKGEWSFLEPLRTRAGRWSVDGLLGSLENLRMESVAVEQAESLKAFGLEQPARVVRLGLSDGGEKVLEIGKAAEGASPSPASPEPGVESPPKPSRYYARDASSRLVAVIPQALVDDLAKGMAELRAKRLLDVATYEVEGIEVEAEGQKRSYVRSSSKDEQQGFDVYKWKRTAPEAQELDTNKVQDALFKIGGLEASEFVDAPGAPARYGLDQPALRVTLRYGEGKPASWFEIGRKDDAAYARRPDDSSILKLDLAKADELLKAFSEL